MFRGLLFAVLLLGLSACQESASRTPEARILAMGDSLMSWHGLSGAGIADVVEAELGQPVIDRSVAAAMMRTRFDAQGNPQSGVQAQYIDGPWDWVLVNGGGNDLWLGCGCWRCDTVMDRMITVDGRGGQIPAFLRRARDRGARVVYFGYLRSPGVNSPIEHCKPAGDELEARLARMARQEPGISFIPVQDIAQPGDTSYFAFDRIHPSKKSSRLIGERLAAYMRAARP